MCSPDLRNKDGTTTLYRLPPAYHFTDDTSEGYVVIRKASCDELEIVGRLNEVRARGTPAWYLVGLKSDPTVQGWAWGESGLGRQMVINQIPAVELAPLSPEGQYSLELGEPYYVSGGPCIAYVAIRNIGSGISKKHSKSLMTGI
jgi:hypothetical protein